MKERVENDWLRPSYPSLARSCRQSVYEVETGVTPVPPSVTPEALFLCACRALAYSVSAAATAASPIDSLRGYAAAAAGGSGTEGATAIDHGDATRLRCLRLVAGVLRRAAGQAGLEETVSKKPLLCCCFDVPRAHTRKGPETNGRFICRYRFCLCSGE